MSGSKGISTSLSQQVKATQGEVFSSLILAVEEGLKESEPFIAAIGEISRTEAIDAIEKVFADKFARLK